MDESTKNKGIKQNIPVLSGLVGASVAYVPMAIIDSTIINTSILQTLLQTYTGISIAVALLQTLKTTKIMKTIFSSILAGFFAHLAHVVSFRTGFALDSFLDFNLLLLNVSVFSLIAFISISVAVWLVKKWKGGR